MSYVHVLRACPTLDVVEYAKKHDATIVDLRSDTISRPSPSMRRAMFEAEVGDDVWGEDPTVNKLEEKAAKLLNKEAALFVTSGTMGNLISVMNHCDARGSEAYVGEDCHIVLHEQGGSAQLGGVLLCPLPNNPDGTYDLRKLESKMKSDRQHEPISKLVAVENTMNGVVVPQKWIDQLAEVAKKHGLKMHMDGARLWNAAVASGLPASKIVEKFDSVTFCLSKGLGCPAGSVLCGSRAFIDRARRLRKVLGGGMRQVGILAAAGIVALDEIVPVLKEDHRRAHSLARAINDMNSETFSVDLERTKTNMVLMHVKSDQISAVDFVARLQTIKDDVEDDKVILRGMALTPRLARFVFYYEITDEMAEAGIKKIKHVIREFDCKS